MRWFWIDRFSEFESGRHAVAIKNVSLAEEHLHDHFPGAPVMPNTLVIEGLAQTGGLLVAEHNAFRERVILAKIAKARFHLPATPGDTLVYRVAIDDMAECLSHFDVVEGGCRDIEEKVKRAKVADR